MNFIDEWCFLVSRKVFMVNRKVKIVVDFRFLRRVKFFMFFLTENRVLGCLETRVSQ